MQQPSMSSVRWEWIGQGWNMFTQRWGVWVVHMLLFALVVIAVLLPFYAIVFATAAMADQSDPSAAPPAIIFLAMAIFLPLAFITSAFLMAGTYKSAMKQLRGEPTGVGDLFSGADCFLRVTGAVLLVALMAGVGAILCLIPGLIIQGMCFYTIPLVVERGLGPIEAIKASIDATKKDWLMYTLFSLVVGLIAGVGVVLCYVGALATYPMLFTITSIAYRDTFGVAGAGHSSNYSPPPPPSSWQ